MAGEETIDPVNSVERLLTAEDLLQIPERECRYELLDGRLRSRPFAGAQASACVARLGTILLSDRGNTRDSGILAAGAGIILRRAPDHVRAPALSLTLRDRLPEGRLPEGYLELVPDLIVEVVSPNDTATEVQGKVEEWLAAGARLVWAVYPARHSIVAYRSLTDIRVYTEADTLDATPVLPDFSCPVARIFE